MLVARLIDHAWLIVLCITAVLNIVTDDLPIEVMQLMGLAFIGAVITRICLAQIVDALLSLDAPEPVVAKAKKQKKAKAVQSVVDDIPEDSRPAVIVQYDLWGNAVQPTYPDTDNAPARPANIPANFVYDQSVGMWVKS